MAGKRKPPDDDSNPALPLPLDRQKFTLRYRTTLPSTRPAINAAVQEVLRVADEAGLVDEGKADLEIALREALANAIIHGNKNLKNKNKSVKNRRNGDILPLKNMRKTHRKTSKKMEHLKHRPLSKTKKKKRKTKEESRELRVSKRALA